MGIEATYAVWCDMGESTCLVWTGQEPTRTEAAAYARKCGWRTYRPPTPGRRGGRTWWVCSECRRKLPLRDDQMRDSQARQDPQRTP